MRHPTYKHLEGRLRLGAFSVGQWLQIAVSGVIAALFGAYVSPLPSQATLFVSIVGAGLPIALSYGAMGLEFSVTQFGCSAWRYWRQPRRFVPGPGQATPGYFVVADAATGRIDARPPAEPELLWDV